MSQHSVIRAGDLMVQGNSSIDPRRYASEVFDLLSIPAFDAGEPEVTSGSNIGSSKQLVQPNDILISKIVPHIRRAWVVSANRGRRQIASGEWIVFRSEKVFPGYLRHALVSDGFHSQFMQTVSGVGGSLLRARPSHVGKIELPLPPLPEQRRIAEVLDRAETLRAQRRQALAQLDALGESIFLDMFGDPLTNPKAWPMRKLSTLGALDRGVSKHRPRNDPLLLGGSHPLIQTGDVANCDRYLRTFTATYSDAGLRQSRKWLAGTLCITIAANIAKTGVLGFDACFPDSVVGFTPNKLATTEYVQTWLSFLQKMLEDSAPESAQKNINLAILRELNVPLPPIEVQRTYVALLARIEGMKATQRQAALELDALFTSLQHRAFRGEL